MMSDTPPTPVLIDLKGGGINVVRELSQAEWQEYRRAVVHLRDFHAARMLLPIIEAELADFRAVINEANAALSSAKRLDTFTEQFDFEANRHFLGYLAAVRTYLDHTETRLKRQYGPGEPFASFKKACSAAYDGSFAYRFLGRLRNFGQHCGLPIGHIEVSASAAARGGPTQKLASLGFDPSDLLHRGGEKIWGKSVSRELAAMSGVLDVEPVAKEVTARLSEIDRITMEAERSLLLLIAQPITDLFGDIAKSGGIPAAGILTAAVQDRTTMDFVRAPIPALAWLGFTYKAVVF